MQGCLHPSQVRQHSGATSGRNRASRQASPLLQDCLRQCLSDDQVASLRQRVAEPDSIGAAGPPLEQELKGP